MPAFESLLFQHISNTMDLGVLVVDQDMQIIYWNHWLETVSGRSKDSMKGKYFDAEFPELVDSRVYDAIRQGLEHDFPAFLSQPLNKSPFALYKTEDSGELNRIEQSILIQPLTDDAGKRYTVVHITDVSHQVKREALSRMQVQLEQAAMESIATILNSLDALVYVSDMRTYELIFINDYGKKTWGSVLGRKCYQYLQSGQSSPCKFCTNNKIVGKDGVPTEVYVWEFKNTANKRWYQCRDQAIKWIDGRMVRLEVAFDITDIKKNEARLESARKYAEDLAMNDSLTRTGNRRAFFEYAKKQFSYLRRNDEHKLSLVILDVDFFKKINDRYGHAAGDDALVRISETIKKHIREADNLFRIGGEEFVIVMMGCDEQQAKMPVECIRIAVMGIDFYCNDEKVNISCSFGISQYRHDIDVDGLLAEADSALYFAKKNGRNRSCIYSELPQEL